MARLAKLQRLSDRAEKVSERLTDFILGELPPDECAAFAHIPDPTLAFTRVASTLRRIVALEERLDETAETREARIAAEAAAREAAIRAAEAARDREAAAAPIREKKKRIRRALHDASLDVGDEIEHSDRESLLDDLFREYAGYDDFSGDQDEIIEDLSWEFAKEVARWEAEANADDDDPPEAEPLEKRAAKLLEKALFHLARLTPEKPPDG